MAYHRLYLIYTYTRQPQNTLEMYVCMYNGWAFTALAPRPTVVYCA
jgi:hypothetical protein